MQFGVLQAIFYAEKWRAVYGPEPGQTQRRVRSGLMVSPFMATIFWARARKERTRLSNRCMHLRETDRCCRHPLSRLALLEALVRV